MAFLEQIAMDREGDGEIGAGPDREVQIGLARERRRAWIDHDDEGAVVAGFLEEGHDVNARDARVHAPHDDHLRVGIVFVADRRHLSVEPEVRRAGRRRAYRAEQARRAESTEQDRVGVILREEAVRAAVAERQNRLRAAAVSRRHELLRDQIERIVPGHALEESRSLCAAPDGRIEQSIVAIHAFVEAAHLGADVAVGDVVFRRSVDLRDASAAHRHIERARIGTVQRAGGGYGRFRRSDTRLRHAHPRIEEMAHLPQVIIIGGGFAGLAAARRLGRSSAR